MCRARRTTSEQIEKGFTSLFENPQRGAYPKELLAIGPSGLCDNFFKPYRIIYRVMAENVYVVIADGRRQHAGAAPAPPAAGITHTYPYYSAHTDSLFCLCN